MRQIEILTKVAHIVIALLLGMLLWGVATLAGYTGQAVQHTDWTPVTHQEHGGEPVHEGVAR